MRLERWRAKKEQTFEETLPTTALGRAGKERNTGCIYDGDAQSERARKPPKQLSPIDPFVQLWQNIIGTVFDRVA